MSSRNYNFSKLEKFKKANPEYKCIYATINDSTSEKTKNGYIKKIKHDGVEIEHHSGYKFLHFIFADDTEIIVDKIKKLVEKYTL